MQNALRAAIVACALFGFCARAGAQDQALIEAGEALYDEHCAMCHGEKLRGAGAVPDLRALRTSDRARFDERVTEGQGQMPAWRGVLNEAELNQLWAYIRVHAFDK